MGLIEEYSYSFSFFNLEGEGAWDGGERITLGEKGQKG